MTLLNVAALQLPFTADLDENIANVSAPAIVAHHVDHETVVNLFRNNVSALPFNRR